MLPQLSQQFSNINHLRMLYLAFDAITTENGLTVENVLPTELARKIAPTQIMSHIPWR